MENRAHALLAGLFLLILGLSAVGALWWFSGRHEESNHYIVQTRRNVTGLNLQAQVRYRGIRVGKVDAIRLDPTDARTTLVGITVRKDIPITRGTVARLGYQGVTGIAHVLLEDAGQDASPLPGDSDSPARIAMQDSLVQELTDVGGDTLRQARDLLTSLNDVLRPENRQAMTRMLANLETTTAHARDAAARLERLLGPQNLQRAQATLAHVEQAAVQVGPLVVETRSLVARLHAAGAKFEAALGDPHAGGVGALAPRFNQLAMDLAATSHQLGRVLQILEESPQSLIFGRHDVPPGPGEAGFVAPTIVREKP